MEVNFHRMKFNSPSLFILLSLLLGFGTHSGQFTYSIIEIFYYIAVVLLFVFHLLLVFTFYLFISDPLVGDPAADNVLEIVENEV